MHIIAVSSAHICPVRVSEADKRLSFLRQNLTVITAVQDDLITTACFGQSSKFDERKTFALLSFSCDFAAFGGRPVLEDCFRMRLAKS